MDILKEIAENLVSGQADKVRELTQSALEQGISVQQLLDNGLLMGMNELGKLFEQGRAFLPELIFGGKAMTAAMEILEPLLASAGVERIGKIALGTVKGDIHDIGKNLVAFMLRGAGFEVVDLGTAVTQEAFVEAAREGAQLVGMSALVTSCLPYMKTVIDALEAAGLRERVKTLIGGATVSQSYADEIGADAYGADAVQAVEKAKDLLGLA